jgi:hypothetical protein
MKLWTENLRRQRDKTRSACPRRILPRPMASHFYNELPKERAHELLVDSLHAPTLSIELTPSPQTSNAFDPGTSAASSEIHNSLSASIIPVLSLAVMSIVVELLEWRRMRWNIKTKNITYYIDVPLLINTHFAKISEGAMLLAWNFRNCVLCGNLSCQSPIHPAF